jgi:deoxyribonuclease-1
MDPPDSEEQARNERIAQIQGTRNRFIDNPALADTLGRE